MPNHPISRSTTRNRILSRITRADFKLLQPHLETVDLPVRKPLEARKKRVDQVYFVESGKASVVANGQRNIEVGVTGREGMTGLSVVMGGNAGAPHETVVQIAGSGLRVASDELRKAIGASVPLHHALLRYARAFMIQTTQTALANGRSKIDERLANGAACSGAGPAVSQAREMAGRVRIGRGGTDGHRAGHPGFRRGRW
jgi:CRP-like cAMP-binding protein